MSRCLHRAGFSLLALLILLPGGASGAVDAARYQAVFAKASRAYDENRMEEAIRDWQSLVDAGQRLTPVWFNLGNAYYRNGQLGNAIHAYRQAWYLSPRDPDIRANLGFAAQTAGIALPSHPALVAWMLDISRREWLQAASLFFWLATATAVLWILFPRFRAILRPLPWALAALLLLSMAGLLVHQQWIQRPECVVMEGPSSVLSGPFEAATPLLSIPEGTIVRRTAQRGGWSEIRYDSTTGWLPSAVLAAVP
ncbi:MAG: tetratricopeptide repeat protein [Verrucomicrobiota bacterium]|jgi:tetratricopeptide (TPR) repeat protein|nr:tetratricopeptide repeat protein [Verrucomicrobiota bacterium]